MQCSHTLSCVSLRSSAEVGGGDMNKLIMLSGLTLLHVEPAGVYLWNVALVCSWRILWSEWNRLHCIKQSISLYLSISIYICTYIIPHPISSPLLTLSHLSCETKWYCFTYTEAELVSNSVKNVSENDLTWTSNPVFKRKLQFYQLSNFEASVLKVKASEAKTRDSIS